MYTTEAGDKLVVAGLAPGGPADRAGVKVGDIVADVAGEKPTSLAGLWRRVWSFGPPGSQVPLKLLRKSALMSVRLHSADRNDFLKKPHLH
jgi:S1-C subfamily serine protease